MCVATFLSCIPTVQTDFIEMLVPFIEHSWFIFVGTENIYTRTNIQANKLTHLIYKIYIL